MEYKYTKESLNRVRFKVLARGLLLIFASIIFASLYMFSLEWYFSIAPAAVFFVLGFEDLRGIGKIMQYRSGMRIVQSDIGLTIYMFRLEKPLFLPWNKMRVVKEKSYGGVLNSFTIDTGNGYLKNWTFTNDIEKFSVLYKQVHENVRV